MKHKSSFFLLLLIATFAKISALNVVKGLDTVAEQEVNIPDDIYETKMNLAKRVLDKSSDKHVLDNEVPDLKVQTDSEVLEIAESNNYVYRPLYVYRKIEHSRKRFNMYNAFAG